MRGFFSTAEVISVDRPDGKTYSCASCGLYRNSCTPKMKAHGNFKKGILNIGTFPTKEEDEAGQPFISHEYRGLRQVYAQLGIDLEEDCLNVHSVHCIPLDDVGSPRRPSGYEISCCRRSINRLIAKYQPKVIVLIGMDAVESVVMGHWRGYHGKGITSWRGFTIPDRIYNAWVCPVFDIDFIANQAGYPETQKIWEQDIAKALSKLDKPLPPYSEEWDAVTVSEDPHTVLQTLLKTARRHAGKVYIAFDIETTGLKPYCEGQQIACISFCMDENRAYCIPAPTDPDDLKLLRRILTSPSIYKMAHNMKFEDTWLNVIDNIEVSPWEWDTMQAAHIIDNRSGISSLKMQSFLQFGLIGYEEEIKPYLSSPDSNTLNKVMDCMADQDLRLKLMKYCGIDSLMTYRLAMQQMRLMGAIE